MLELSKLPTVQCVLQGSNSHTDLIIPIHPWVAAACPPAAQIQSSSSHQPGWRTGTARIGLSAPAAASGLAFATCLLRTRPRQRRTQSAASLAQQLVSDGWTEEDNETAHGMHSRAPLLINGKTILTKDTFRVLCPATGNLVGLAPQVSIPQINAAVEAAHRAAEPWASVCIMERRRMLKSCADVLRAELEPLATLQTNESGRPLPETRIEILVAAANFEHAALLLDIRTQEDICEDEHKKVVVRRIPLGVVAVIAPWNAPIVLGWKPTSSALACGNTVILKPAPQTPLTTLRIGELLRPLLPPGVLNVVVGRDTMTPRPGEILTSHPLVRKVVFTGSTAIGRKVVSACAQDFKRMLLELGGNDAAIIREDCDPHAIIDGVFSAAFFNNGQTCCAIKRLYVHESIFDHFVETFVARARRARLGNGLNQGVELGPLANDVQLGHVNELVKDARKNGGQVLCGGGAIAGPPGDDGPNTGLFYLPTIVVGIAEGVRLVDEEQFGPVVPVMPFKTDEEAIRRANGTSYGLGASVWSADIEKANEIADKLKAGTVWVNRHCEFIRNAPFGGIGNSGIGRAGDLSARDLAEYTELKTIALAKAPPPAPAEVPTMACVRIDGQATEMLRERLATIREKPWLDADAFEADARDAVLQFPLQPVNFRSELLSVADPAGPCCLVVHGLPVELTHGALPSAPGVPGSKTDTASEACLIGSLALLGASIFTYHSQDDDKCPRNLFRESVLHESTEMFGWHRDGRCSPAFHPPRRYYRSEEHVPEFVAAFCLHAQEPASASFVDFRDLCAAMTPDELSCLQNEPMAFFDNETGLRTEQVYVACPSPLDDGSYIVDLRHPDRFEAEGQPQAVSAYQRACDLAHKLTQTVQLQPGSMVIFNNKQCLHAWTPAESHKAPWLQAVRASCGAKNWSGRRVL